ncbi:MAG: hypothetical protein ABID84_03415 [Chloroflexota bacterium]
MVEPIPTGEAKANTTDPESRIMKTLQGYVQGYNVQAVVSLRRSTYRYQSVADEQAALRMRIREMATARVSYGYHRISRGSFAYSVQRVIRSIGTFPFVITFRAVRTV